MENGSLFSLRNETGAEVVLCDKHDRQIKEGLRARNLWQFVSPDMQEAVEGFLQRQMAASLAEDTDAERPDAVFDPFVEIHMEILFLSMKRMAETETEMNGCPMCIALNGDEWIDGALNDMELHFKKQGWMKETVN
jgi:hypothetical protein